MKLSVTRVIGLLMLVCGGASAQTASSDGVRESTDPSRAAEVERKAEMMSGQSSSDTGASGQETQPQKKAKKSSKKSGKKSSKQSTQGSSGRSQ